MTAVVSASAWSNGPAIVSSGATSLDYDYEPELAFDDDETTFWHSEWRGENDEGYTALDDFPQTLIVELDNTYWIDCIGYLTRPDGSRNGSAFELEIWVSTTGAATDFDNDTGWTKVVTGTWDDVYWEDWKFNYDDTGEVVFANLDFDPVEAKLVKLKITNGFGGWACCAALELGFLGVDYTPMGGFVPKSAPGTPAPVSAVVEDPAVVVDENAAGGGEENVHVTEPAPAPVTSAPQTSDNTGIVVFSIMFLTAACLISYNSYIRIAAKNN